MSDQPDTNNTPSDTAVQSAAQTEQAPQADPAPSSEADQSAAENPAITEPQKSSAEQPSKDNPALEMKAVVNDEGGDKEVLEPADWPPNWREKLAGDDKKLLATLNRFTSPKTFSDSYFAMKQKLSSGEYLKALPEDATEEQITEWRKENGIPAKPEEYDTTLPDGLAIGENDKPLVNEFLAEMHKSNAKPEHVKAALSTYYKILENQQAELFERNETKRTETEDALRTEWGNEYRRNINMMNGMLDTFGEETKQALLNARAEDGTLLLNNPGIVRALVAQAREINPVATVVPGAGVNAINAIGDEIASYEKKMREDWNGWHKDNKAQERYRELIAARDKLKARGA